MASIYNVHSLDSLVHTIYFIICPLESLIFVCWWYEKRRGDLTWPFMQSISIPEATLKNFIQYILCAILYYLYLSFTIIRQSCIICKAWTDCVRIAYILCLVTFGGWVWKFVVDADHACSLSHCSRRIIMYIILRKEILLMRAIIHRFLLS